MQAFIAKILTYVFVVIIYLFIYAIMIYAQCTEKNLPVLLMLILNL